MKIQEMTYNLFIILLLFNVSTITPIDVTNFDDFNTIEMFLDEDTTNKNNYTMWYSCGHFARELSTNAKKENITIGSAIVSNNPIFRGKWNSHIYNYVYVNSEIIFINPQTDNFLDLQSVFFKYEYVRLYPDGTQVPSNWRYNLAPTFSYYNWKECEEIYYN